MTIEDMHDLAVQRHQTGQLIEAENLYRRILTHEPHAVQVWNNLGAALQHRGNLDESIACFRRAVALQPDFVDALYNLGIVLDAKEEWNDSAECYRRALALNPDYLPAYNNLANALLPQGQVKEAIAAYDENLKCKPDDSSVAGNRLFALQFDPSRDAEQILREHQSWDRQFAQSLPRFSHSDRNSNSGRRLRIGYVSAHFREHCQAMFTVPLLEAHDHSQVEIFCYSDVAKPDAITMRLMKSADVWKSTVGMTDEALANLIYADRIDILIDLTMHMSGGRPLLFARKPAPISAAWLAYPGTTGLSAIDYRLTDPYLDPPGTACSPTAKAIAFGNSSAFNPHPNPPPEYRERGKKGGFLRESDCPDLTPSPCIQGEGWGGGSSPLATTERYSLGTHDARYSERSLRLPDTFWCYDPLVVGESPEPGPLPALTNGWITFGCLNNFCKVNEGTIELWSRVLQAVPRSRLRLLAPPGKARERTLDQFALRRVEANRMDFVPRQKHWEYMSEFSRIDLGLDTLPYNGHTTSLDSFWMGVPIVTKIGPTVVGRAGLSQLSNLGLPELAAASDEEFVKIAVELAGDLPRLAELRQTLRPRMLASPLMDAKRFARNMEAAYRQMIEMSRIA